MGGYDGGGVRSDGHKSDDLDNADSIYPCGKCHMPVTYDHKGLQFDTLVSGFISMSKNR